MNREQVITQLNKIQKANDVNRFTYEGYDLWPFVKTFLGNKILSVQLKGLESSSSSYLNILLLMLKAPFLVFYYAVFKPKKKHLFIGSNADIETVEAKAVNKHFYLLMKKYKKKALFFNTDFAPSKIANSKMYFSFWFFFSIPFVLSSFFSSKKSKAKKQQIALITQDLKEMLAVFDKITHFDLDEFFKKLAAHIYRIPIYDTTSKFILKTTAVESVSIVCYYNLVGYSFVKNSYDINIPSIDMQHGTQGEIHAAYCDFSNYKSSFSNIIPNYFWCWDLESASVINDWSKACTSHKAFNFGNPWHSSFLKKNTATKDKISILITLQFNYIDQILIDAIKKSPLNYKWLIRLHPLRTDMRATVLEQIKTNKIDEKVEIDLANTLVLPEIFSLINVHISGYSGSISEARNYGIYSIITDPVGEKSFKSLVLSKEAFVAYDATKILNTIKHILDLKELEVRISSIKEIEDSFDFLIERQAN